MKNAIWISIVLVIIIAVSAIFIINPFRKELIIKQVKFDCMANYNQQESNCLDFLQKKMTNSDGGIYTNYLDKPSSGDITQGHAVLSESQGLAMLYFSNKDNKAEFDKHWKFVKNYLIRKEGIVSWRASLSENTWQAEQTSSSVDDIRIIKALATGWNKWHINEYYDSSKSISNGLLKYSIKDNLLSDFYDFKYNGYAYETNLSYLDLDTMHISANFNNKWKNIYMRSLELINMGQTQNMPLYQKSWLWKENKFKQIDKVNMIESLMTYLYMCQDGKKSVVMDNWLRDRLKSDNLFSYYDFNGNPASQDHSTAVYAIIALIASNNADVDLYNLAIKNMLKLQVTDQNSEIYGSFGNPKTLDTYSFDNLMALLAFSTGKVGD